MQVRCLASGSLRMILACLIVLALRVAVVGAAAAQDGLPATPNIVLVMIDDLGWSDLACQGNPLVETPRLDQLAEEGMRFTDAYAAAPVCSPTRAALMTGLAPARLKITNHIPDQQRFIPDQPVLLPAKMNDRLAFEEVTIAERLKAGGYATGFFGKWHLAGRGDERFFPEHHGFDLNIGGCDFGGPPTFFDPYRIPTIENREPGEYLPDRLADEVVDFVRKHQDSPFFVCLWNYTVHWPMEAPEPLLEKYADRTGPGLNDTRYGAMIEAMDRSIGVVLDELKRLELEEETLVIFTSDNGGFGGVSDCRPLRESKGYLYEGGIRVPLIVRWPGVVEAGTLCDTPVITMDFYPTILEAVGLEPSARALDGASLLPLLKQEQAWQRDALFFHYPNYAWHRSNRLGSAVRLGDYKLIHFFDDDSDELYHLSSDIGEANDLSAQQAEKTAELRERLMNWLQETDAELPIPVER